MTYRVRYSPLAAKFLRKLDPHAKSIVMKWVDTHLEGCTNPRACGKGLTGDRSTEWRYRVGIYRLIADIRDDLLLIQIADVNRRDKVYRS
ncbi:MAG: type II toxin-antitoxin system RelE/ParE family toxin [Coriobacteriales bacterium]|jgi:mRNA interferase RelE/StbE|nr:type II toxin-antitoxin system RelE/ParE family toxin [Coriobacteriales bacterium]